MPGRIAPPPLVLMAALALAGCTALDDASQRNIIGPVFFACDDGTRLTVRFDQDDDTARVTRRRGLPLILPRNPSASGYAYEDAGFSLRGKGRDAFWQTPERGPVHCRERSSQ